MEKLKTEAAEKARIAQEQHNWEYLIRKERNPQNLYKLRVVTYHELILRSQPTIPAKDCGKGDKEPSSS